MTRSLVLTVIGSDRPGLVSLLSATARSYGANWLQSRLTTLAGQFAGIVHLPVPTARADDLIAGLQQLGSQGLRVIVATSEDEDAASPNVSLRLELIVQDRPGIVREISHAIASHNVSIHQLHTDCYSAPCSGETMFRARARLSVPAGADTAALRATLEDLANDLMVDINFDELAAHAD